VPIQYATNGLGEADLIARYSPTQRSDPLWRDLVEAKTASLIETKPMKEKWGRVARRPPLEGVSIIWSMHISKHVEIALGWRQNLLRT
jgi:hypothetical protein